MAKKAQARKQSGKSSKLAPKVAKKAAVPKKAAPMKVAASKKAVLTPATPPAKKVGKAAAVPQALAKPLLQKAPVKAPIPKAPIAARQHSAQDPESVCREVACEGLSTTAGYCRLHYIKNWKKIKRKELILKEKKLNQYIEELVAKYPDKYIEAIRQDLASDRDFAKVITDLDLDESIDDFDVEGESVDAVIDNIKREFDDEGDAF